MKADIHRGGRSVPRELLLGIAREEDPDTARALWKRLQLTTLSVRQFRDEKDATKPEGVTAGEVLAAARKLNRALARLLADDCRVADASRLRRPLRRTERLVKRTLATIAERGKPAADKG